MTIDNLGEAAELGDGTWPEDVPVGHHFTVEVVRRLLPLLERRGVRATFFIEAANAEVYPEVLREIADAGHEIACHAWQHEQWSTLPAEKEGELLARSTQALGDLGHRPAGFRPPGGQVTAETPRLLTELGYSYFSPAGARAGISQRLAVIPFDWRLVDAFFYVSQFAGLRERHGEPSEPQTPDVLRRRFEHALRSNAVAGDQITLLFHLMLLDAPEALSALDSVLAQLGALIDEGAAECLTMREMASRMLQAPHRYTEPALETSTWWAS